MAIEFKEKVRIKQKGSPEAAALRLEALLNKHIPLPAKDSESYSHYSMSWRLRDSSDNRSIGTSVSEVFEEFRDHDLEPYSLFHDRQLPAAKEGDPGVTLSIHYAISSEEINLEIAGTDRMAVDGLAATCQRIKRALEKQPSPSAQNVLLEAQSRASSDATFSPRIQSAPVGGVASTPTQSPSWLKRTWKDHTAQFIVTLVAGVLVIAIGLWLGLSPKP